MARVRFDRDVNARYRPGLAPWRGHEVLICSTPGQALPAGTPLTIPDSIAYSFHRDWQALYPGCLTWEALPDTAELEAQRDVAVANAPHVDNPPVSVELPTIG